jgi:uroporphyrinogen-III synthase
MTKLLTGLKVLVTRPRGQAEAFAGKLQALGAEAIFLPAIDILPLENTFQIDSALVHLETFDWVVLTSVNGVEAVRGRMKALGVPSASLAARHLAVIGPATGRALEAFCRKGDVMPQEFVSEAIFRTLGEVSGKRFLLARADLARADLAVALRKAGADVTEVAAYRIVASEGELLDLKKKPDFITLTSSASAKATVEKLLQQGLDAWLRHIPIVCIGPITAATVRDLGYRVAGTAKEYTTDGLVEVLLELSGKELANA